MFAISTSWNSWKHYYAKDIVAEIKQMGFETIELNFSLTASIVEEMIRLKENGSINVVSLHNFCPIPIGIPRKYASPDSPSLSSINERERHAAVEHTKKTIDTASSIGAKAVVIHSGRVRMKERIRELATLKEKNDEKRFQRLKEKTFKERLVKSQRFYAKTLASLEELCEHALKRNISLGLENRYYISEIPALEEMEMILAKLAQPPIYYWHDVGHAQVHENLGLSTHADFLEKFSHRLLGIHLHDIEGIDDHRAPLKGSFDFQLLKPFLGKETLKILEPHYPAAQEDIIAGTRYLERLFKDE